MKTTKTRKTVAWRLLSILVILTMLIPTSLFVAPVPVAHADTTVTYYSTNMDSYVRQDRAGNNYGNDSRMYVRSYYYWWLGYHYLNRRSFVRFNISIPSGATIVSARLRLYMDQNPGQNRTYQVWRVVQNWSEGSRAPSAGTTNPA